MQFSLPSDNTHLYIKYKKRIVALWNAMTKKSAKLKTKANT